MRWLVLLLLAGCASEPYWQRTKEPLPVYVVKAVPDETTLRRMCRQTHLSWEQTLNGCTARLDGFAVIFYRTNRQPWEVGCTLRHERAHAAGWMHDDRTAFSTDCGPKEFKE